MTDNQGLDYQIFKAKKKKKKIVQEKQSLEMGWRGGTYHRGNEDNTLFSRIKRVLILLRETQRNDISVTKEQYLSTRSS